MHVHISYHMISCVQETFSLSNQEIDRLEALILVVDEHGAVVRVHCLLVAFMELLSSRCACSSICRKFTETRLYLHEYTRLQPCSVAPLDKFISRLSRWRAVLEGWKLFYTVASILVLVNAHFFSVQVWRAMIPAAKWCLCVVLPHENEDHHLSSFCSGQDFTAVWNFPVMRLTEKSAQIR